MCSSDLGLEEIEPVPPRDRLDPLPGVLELRGEPASGTSEVLFDHGYLPLPRKSLIDRMIDSRSGIFESATRSSATSGSRSL